MTRNISSDGRAIGPLSNLVSLGLASRVRLQLYIYSWVVVVGVEGKCTICVMYRCGFPSIARFFIVQGLMGDVVTGWSEILQDWRGGSRFVLLGPAEPGVR